MRLLFVKPKHIGDALLLTPTLAAAGQRYPDALIWVVVRSGTEDILAGCPVIDRLLTTAAPENQNRSRWSWWNDLKLLRELRAQRFDYAFELSNSDRGRLLAGFSKARRRCANAEVYPLSQFWQTRFTSLSHFDWRERHQVEADFFSVAEQLPLGASSPPPLIFQRKATRGCHLGSLADYVVIHPGTRWQRKRWPEESWIELGRKLLNRVSTVVISVGPDVEEIASGARLAAALGSHAVSTDGKLSWAQLAGLLYAARLFVGLDTASMHLAAACQCPTVALFAASVARHWHPWRVRHRLVGAALKPGERALDDAMDRIPPGEVLAACDELLAAPVSG